MKSKIVQAIKHTSIYGLGNIATKLIGIILLPIYTTHIKLNDFGLYGLFEIILQVLPILSLGLPAALHRWLGLKKYSQIRGSLLFTSFIFLSLFQIVLFIFIVPITYAITNTFLTIDYFYILIIILSIIYFQLLYQVSLVLLRMDERSVFYAIANIVKIIVHLTSIIYLITIKNLGFISIFWGELAGNLVMFIILIPYLIKNFECKFNAIELKAMLRFGAPTVFSSFGRQIFSFSDRYLLVILISKASMGLYLLGYKIANAIWVFLVTSFNIALPALAWSEAHTENQNRFFSKMLTYFTFVLIWASLFLSTYSKGIVHYFVRNESYWDAYIIIPILSLGFVVGGMNTVINYGLLVEKKTQRMPSILFLSLGINIVSNLILVNYFDYIGTAFALIITSFFQVFLTYLFSRKYFNVDWEFKKIFIMIIIAIGLFLLSIFFDNYSPIQRIIYKGLIILSFPFVLYFFNFYEQIEIATIKRISIKYLNKLKM